MGLLSIFSELDQLYESTELTESTSWIDRDILIKDLKAAGKHYDFNNYTDKQLFRIWERVCNEDNFDVALEDAAPEISHCDSCGRRLTDGGFCPACDDGYEDLEELKENSVCVCSGEESTKASRTATKVAWKRLLREAAELSTTHAVTSVVDQIKSIYEAGLFEKLPVGRENALTISIYGPDKERIAGYFEKRPEFNYELNRDSGIVSHEFISDKYDIEVFDEFVSMYKIPQNESVNRVLNTQNINETINKENYEMNFQTIMEELDKLYEAEQREADRVIKLAEADEEVLVDDEPIVDDETEEIVIEDEAEESSDEEAPAQIILACSGCGALVIKDETAVNIDDETDLANVDEECQYCEEAKGYTIVGAVAPYDGPVVAEEETEETEEETEEVQDEDVTEALLEGKITDSIKKIGTRLGADAATCVRGLAELISDLIQNDTLYDAAEYIENKAVLKALESGNETVLNTCTKEDIEELRQDIEEYKKAKADKKADKADK